MSDTPEHKVAEPHKKKGSRHWFVPVLVIFGVVSLLAHYIPIAINAYQGNEASGPSSEETATTGDQASTGTVIETLTCNPSWENGGGWCESQSLPAGVYRLRLTRWDYQLATPDGALPVPEDGIPLGRWAGQPFEEQFRKEAPLGSVEKVGVPLYRVTGEAPIIVTNGATVSLPEGGIIRVGVNMLPYPDAYKGNTGGMTISINQ